MELIKIKYMNNTTKTVITTLSFLLLHKFSCSRKQVVIKFIFKQAGTKLSKIYLEAIQKIKEEYVDEVSEKQLVEAAIDGMLSSLDPYSRF